MAADRYIHDGIWQRDIPRENQQMTPYDKAIKALKLVYDNSTEHDWPEDIWNAIVDALYEEHRKTMLGYSEPIQEPVIPAFLRRPGSFGHE